MSTTMKAISVSASGGLENLVATQVAVPQPGPYDVLVNVKAVSVNPVEAKMRAGKWHGGTLSPGSILGFDAAGTVHSVGPAVPAGTFDVGQEVWLLGSTIPGHSNAEYVLADYRVVALKPKTLSFEDAAAIPLVGLTAWELFEQLKVGEEPGAILIINGAGGVGSVATQLARNVRGLSTVISTASRETSINHTKSLGATHVISHHEPLKPQIDALNLEVPIKYIAVFTPTTKDVLAQAIDIIAPYGQIGLAVQGPPGSYDGIGAGQKKSVSIHWGFVFTRVINNWNIDTDGQGLTKIASLVDEGKIKSIATKCLDLTVQGLRDAHGLMESGQMVGKVVLKVPAQGAFQ